MTSPVQVRSGVRPTGGRARRFVNPLLTLTVGMVVADSAVVTPALPEILRNLGGRVGQVAWVLIAFNLVLAVAVVPAARACARNDPRRLGAAAIAIFAGGSAACAVAPSQDVLIAARCVQALGCAVALMACLELLVAINGDERGSRAWAPSVACC